MPSLSRQQHMALILALFAVWMVVSWMWYVCGIKNLCSVPTLNKTAAIVTPVAEAGDVACEAYLTEDIRIDTRNSSTEVRNLERFLNVLFGEHLASDGLYGHSDIAAVKRYEVRRLPGRTPEGNVSHAVREMVNSDACVQGALLKSQYVIHP